MSKHEVCAIAATDVVSAYAARTLPGAELDDFEVHLLECAHCRDAVREAAALHLVLTAAAAHGGPRGARYYWWVPLLGAAALATVLITNRPDALGALGAVDAPPPFVGLDVRATQSAETAAVDEAMALYERADYERAERAFAALEANTTDPGVPFFLGAARLMLGANDSAAAAFGRAASPGSPYAAEAEYYAAKAWLRLGQRDAAILALDRAAEDATVRNRAGALRDSILSLRR
jgi:tetratricopeptide (TPR) repeat protein